MYRYDVYVALLADNKYYIQKSKSVMKSYVEECSGRGCMWTRKHKPISLFAIYGDRNQESIDSFMAFTIKTYINKYGLDNVRGRPFTKPKLDNDSYSTFMDIINCNLCDFKTCNCSRSSCSLVS